MKVWQLVVRLAAGRKYLYLVHGVLWLIFYLVGSASGLVVRMLFDALAPPDQARAWAAIGLLALVALSRNIMHLICNVVEYRLYATFVIRLRNNLLAAMMANVDLAASDAAGETISRFRDDADELALFANLSVEVPGKVVFLMLTIGLMASISLVVTLAVVLPLLLIMAVIGLAGHKVRENRRASQQAVGSVTGFLGQMFGAAQAVKAANAEQHVAAHLGRLNEVRRRATLRDRLFTELLDSSYFNTVTVSTGLILLFASPLIQRQTFTVGDLALFLAYLSGVAYLFASLGAMVTRYRQAEVALERLTAASRAPTPQPLVTNTPLHLAGPPPATRRVPAPSPAVEERLAVLEVRDLCYRYPGSTNGIDRISLTLRRGTLTVLTGRIGAGKTTCLEALMGLLPPASGELRWNGRVIDQPAQWLIPPRCAYTPQIPRLFSDSIRENILLGLPASPAALAEATRLAVLDPDLAGFAAGPETLVGPQGIKLSGGQIQRVAAARMFVRGTDLLVMDDLSSALDVETERQLWDQLLALHTHTYLAVSHRPAVLRRADHIVVLDEGRVVAEGTLAHVLATAPHIAQFWGGAAPGSAQAQ